MPRTAERRGFAPVLALTIFLSAFLLFEVQPLVAKEILPWFGGSAGVWTTCMLFFQLALLGGYGYAHGLAGRATARSGSLIHRWLLAASLLSLPILPPLFWKPSGGGAAPVWRILALLAVTVGMPYFLLSATSPLLQTWYSRAREKALPYRFFALSNLGSLLALTTYPVAVEPNLALRTQAWIWSGAYAVFAGLCFWLARASAKFVPRPLDLVAGEGEAGGVSARTRIEWLLLAACASGLLLAVTNHITQNVAAIPFLWVLPLCLYLLSFILTFESARWYRRRMFFGLFAVAVGSMGYAIAGQVNIRDLRVLIPVFTAGLFVCCMVCHGELALRKPAARHLTAFYLMIAAGGAAGGVFVALIAPALFPALFELPTLLTATPALVLYLAWRERPVGEGRAVEFERSQFWPMWVGAAAATVALAGYLVQQEAYLLRDARLVARNFYGALRVTENDAAGFRELAHGSINHGEQYLDPQRRRIPTTYYAPATGIGLLMADLQKRGPVRLGVIGLGTGTMAAWGRAGDAIEFYEINPLVESIARSWFTYLKDTPARLQVTLGDARLSLDAESPRGFDVLAVDAFSGDAIPVHLLTREAFAIYRRHLRPGGVLAVHTSNKYLDLAPPVAQLAREAGLEAHLIENERDDATQTFAADWVLIGARERERFPWLDEEETEITPRPGLRPWTDDFSNLWQVLK